MRLTNAALLLSIGTLMSSCAVNPAPDGWLTPIGESQKAAWGGWVEVRTQSPPRAPAVRGELIAVEAAHIVVLTDHGAEQVAKSRVRTAVVAGYDQPIRPVTTAATIGGISAITHGVFAVLTIPAWVGAGRYLAGEAWSYAKVSYPERQWEDLRKYARFPQGLPPGIDLATLKPKVVPADTQKR